MGWPGLTDGGAGPLTPADYLSRLRPAAELQLNAPHIALRMVAAARES